MVRTLLPLGRSGWIPARLTTPRVPETESPQIRIRRSSRLAGRAEALIDEGSAAVPSQRVTGGREFHGRRSSRIVKHRSLLSAAVAAMTVLATGGLIYSGGLAS